MLLFGNCNKCGPTIWGMANVHSTETGVKVEYLCCGCHQTSRILSIEAVRKITGQQPLKEGDEHAWR